MGLNLKGTVTVQVKHGPLPITQGGTSHDTAPGAINALMPPQKGNATKILVSNGTVAGWRSAGSTGLSAPAGDNQQVQFNDNGILGASTLLYDKVTNTLTVSSDIIPFSNVDIGSTTANFNNMYLRGLASLTYMVETIVDGGETGTSTLTPDSNLGTIYRYTVTGDITLDNLLNVVPGTHMTVILMQDSVGEHTLSSTMKFADGYKTLTPYPGAYDIIHIFYNGSVYYAVLTGFLESTELILRLPQIRFVLCAPYITLRPDIVSGGEYGHTFFWEQLSGGLVDWGMSDMHSIEVVYAEINTIRDDKTFRLWIDKGTPNEYYLDTTIYGTPTEFLPSAVGARGWQGVRALDPQINIAVTVSPALLEHGNLAIIVTDITPVIVYWTLPTTITDISATAIEVNSVGFFEQRKYVVVNNTGRYYTALSEDSIKFRVYFTPTDYAIRNVLTPPMRLPRITGDTLTAIAADDDLNWSITANNGGLIRTIRMLELFPFYVPSDLGTYSASAKGYQSSKVVKILTMETYWYEDLGTYGASAKGFTNSKVTTLLWRSTIGG